MDKWDDSDWERAEAKWQEDYKKLDKAYYKFRAYYNRNRKCDCEHVSVCDHFEKALQKVLGKQSWELCQRGFRINMGVFDEVMGTDFSKDFEKE